MPPSQETAQAMNRHILFLAPLFLLTACGSDHGLHRSARELNDRLRVTMAPDIAAGNATVQPLSNGALVTLLGGSEFPDSLDAKADRYRDVRASVIQGLLDPSLVRIAVADTAPLPAYRRDIRVQNVNQYFQDNGLGLTLLPPTPAPVLPSGATVPPGLGIAITLDCPEHPQRGNWGRWPTLPSCY